MIQPKLNSKIAISRNMRAFLSIVSRLLQKFVCHTLNANMYPAKDRSGCLNEIEEAHLEKLLTKIKKGK